MIVLRTPKGWTGPKEVDGKQVEGTFRSHQVPMGDMDRPEHVQLLEEWMKSYKPEELFDESGKLISAVGRRWRRRANGAWAQSLARTAACFCVISDAGFP